MKSPVLLLIDLQNDYFHGGKMPLPGMEKAADNALKILQHFRGVGWPVYHAYHVENDKNATFFLANTSGAEIHESLKPVPGEAKIKKHFPNAFRETSLYMDLRNANIETIVFCGAMTNMCIDSSVRAAADLEFETVLIHDACAACELEFKGHEISDFAVHASFIASLAEGYAEVRSAEEFLASYSKSDQKS